MSQLDHLSDEDIQFGLRREFQTAAENAIAPFKAEIAQIKSQMQAFGQRLSRPPGCGGQPSPLTHSMARALHGEQKFTNWLREPHTNRSHFAVEVPFAVKSAFETKAGTPISGVGISEPFRVLGGPPQPALRVGQLMPRIQVLTGGSVTFTRETSFVPADVVPETQLKPESTLTFANVVETFATIATYVRISLQSLMDTPAMSAWTDTRLAYAVLLCEEQYLLNGPAGLLALAGTLDPAYAPPASGSTQLDYIGAAIGQLEAQGYTVDGVVLNGVDASKARLLKTTQGEYVWADPDSPVGTSQMWSIPTVLSPSLASGSFLVGAFGQGTVLFDRQMLTIQISYEDQDNFVKNLATIRGEERAALAIPLPGALVKGTFTGTTMAANAKK